MSKPTFLGPLIGKVRGQCELVNADSGSVLASQVERLNALMRELLDYGKPAALVLEDTEAAGLVQVALDLARPLATAEDVALSTSAVRPLPLIRADRQRVVQVLHNLIVNAVQHSGRGTTVEVVLQPATLRDARAVAFLVRDRGPGFSDGDEARVFEPFFSRRRGGTGMGLALAHRLVHDHGGEIVAANREGGGACLRVVLPAAGDGTRATT